MNYIWMWPLHAFQAWGRRPRRPAPAAGLSSPWEHFPTCRQQERERRAQQTVWLCACESVVSKYIVLHALSDSQPRETQFLPRNLLKAFWFCCFVNMNLIPKFEVSHDLRDPTSSAPSMHRRESMVLVFHSRACTPWCSQAKHPRTRCHCGHARDEQLQVMLWWVSLSTTQTKNQCSETS